MFEHRAPLFSAKKRALLEHKHLSSFCWEAGRSTSSVRSWEGRRVSAWNSDSFEGGELLIFLPWSLYRSPWMRNSAFLSREFFQKAFLNSAPLCCLPSTHTEGFMSRPLNQRLQLHCTSSAWGCRNYVWYLSVFCKTQFIQLDFFCITQYYSGMEVHRKVLQDSVFQWLQICLLWIYQKQKSPYWYGGVCVGVFKPKLFPTPAGRTDPTRPKCWCW